MNTRISEDGKSVIGYDDTTQTVNIMDRETGKVTSRPYTATELVELTERQRLASQTTNEEILHDPSTVDPRINAILSVMGKGSTDVPTSITGVDSLQDVLNMSNADIGTDFAANTGRWIKFLIRAQVRVATGVVLALRLAGHRFGSAEIGDPGA